MKQSKRIDKKKAEKKEADLQSGELHALILAGGSGTRLWPLSRSLFPKQLLAFIGEKSLLQQTAARILELVPSQRIWVVTNHEHAFEVRSQLMELDENFAEQVVSEPSGRNTLPAILLGMDRICQADKNAVVAVFPADHEIGREKRWLQDISVGVELARQQYCVTFGISPDKPETGYGYILAGDEINENACLVKGFVEKPDFERAKEYVKSGKYFWNSGMFVFLADVFLQAVKRFQPEIFTWWEKRNTRPLIDDYRFLPNLSVDYGIMEQLETIAMVRSGFEWDDLGNWEALFRKSGKDESDCVCRGDVLNLDSKESFLFSDGGKLVCIGLKDIIAVQTKDATLLCHVDQVQKVKTAVDILKQQGSRLVETHVQVKRPWGSYRVLEEGKGYKIKRIVVSPGAKLSSQMHHHRSEHWTVIKGTALVEIDGKERLLVENQSVDIPKTSQHRLSNQGKVPVEIIEIQSGAYLEEDDIIRFDDVYGR